MAEVDLQTVRARVGVHFDKGGSVRDQALFASLCLALPYAHEGRVTKIDVVVSGDEITVTDNGPGVSLGNAPGTDIPLAQKMMCEVGACGEHKVDRAHSKLLCGISLAEVNAISNSASFVTMIDGVAYAQKYSIGVPTAAFKKVDRSSPGTRLRFSLDKRWAGRKGFDIVAVENQMRRLGLELGACDITFSQS